MTRTKSIAATVAALAWMAGTASAEVPVNDAKRTVTETKTAKCMQRARAYRQGTVQPTQGVKGSVSTTGDAKGLPEIGGALFSGSGFSGQSVGGIDLSNLFAVTGSAVALKSEKAGKALAAIGAVAAALEGNRDRLTEQAGWIGDINSLQGSFDRNSSMRAGSASVWGQAVQAGSTTLEIRNQQLLDQIAATNAATRIMAYDRDKARFVDDGAPVSDNTETPATGKTTIADIQAEMDRLAAAAAAARTTPTSTGEE